MEKTSVIATALPGVLGEVIEEGDEEAIAEAMEQWQPVLDIPFNQEQVKEAILNFGEVVDAIRR